MVFSEEIIINKKDGFFMIVASILLFITVNDGLFWRDNYKQKDGFFMIIPCGKSIRQRERFVHLVLLKLHSKLVMLYT